MASSKIAQAGKKLGALLAILLSLLFALFYYGPFYSLSAYAPEQPIPYSHKLHAGDLNIPCLYCHSYARRSEMAGIPSISKCMNCHSNLSLDSDAVSILEKSFEDQRPIEWVRLYDLPDHVWFSHKRHVLKGVECASCHGPVEEMETNQRFRNFRMGFCLDCHQEKQASTDCTTCHT